MSICMMILAGTDSIAVRSDAAAYTEVVFLFLFNTCFAIGWLGMTWLYPAEIVPLKIRAPANALATTGNWIWNFMGTYLLLMLRPYTLLTAIPVVMITPVAFQTIKYQTYIIFAVINAFIFPVVYFFYPETAYRSLEEMDSIFAKCKSIFSVVSIAKEEPRRYGKNGEVLISYEETDMAHRRQSSVIASHLPGAQEEKPRSSESA